MNQQIIVTFDENGKPIIEAEGFTGGQCQQITDAIVAALGGADSVQLKPSFYEQNTDQVDNTLSQAW